MTFPLFHRKYIGFIHGQQFSMKQFVGVELLEPIRDGHDGTIGGYQYFTAPRGHGLHVELTSVIRKLSAAEILLSLKEVLCFFKSKMSEHLQAVNDRDDYIDHLKSKIEHLKSRPPSARPRPSFKEVESDILSEMKSKVLDRARTNSESKKQSFVHPHPLSPITPMSPSRNSFRYSTPIRHSQSIRNSQRLLKHRHFKNMDSTASAISAVSGSSSGSFTETISSPATSEYTSSPITSPSNRGIPVMDRNSSPKHSFGGLAARKSTLPVIADVRESFSTISSQSQSARQSRSSHGAKVSMYCIHSIFIHFTFRVHPD